MISKTEQRATLSLATIFAFRMLGLFMILPVFSLYAHELSGATPALIGLALGIYGLTQAFLQIPFGMLSDKIGRKPIIAAGLVLFASGSVIAALSSSIEGIILGRALQGAGAIGSTIIALVADLTREENRTRAMAVIGLTVGTTFTLAIILGPVFNTWIKVNGIFWLTAVLAISGIIILFTWVPKTPTQRFHRDAEPVPALFRSLIRDKELLRLDFGILASHAILTANFVVLPITLVHTTGIAVQHQWILYLPVLFLAFLAMVPMIIVAEKKRKMKSMFLLAIALIAVTQFSLGIFPDSRFGLSAALFVFFTAFTFMEASLPSLVSKQAPAGSKGTAMGIYSTSQFFGIFLGGALGGWLYGHWHTHAVFLACGVMAGIWLLLASRMQSPPYLSSRSFELGHINPGQADVLTKQLLQIKGVKEAGVFPEEGVAYLKFDSQQIQTEELTQQVRAILS